MEDSADAYYCIMNYEYTKFVSNLHLSFFLFIWPLTAIMKCSLEFTMFL